MSSCPDILQLQSLADGQCGEPEARRLSAHVAACPECAEALRELQQACLPLSVLTEAPPTDLEARLLTAIGDVAPLPALTCDEAREWVSLRMDGELAHGQMQRLDAHLLACADCYRAAQELEAVSGVLRTTAAEPAPLGLLSRIETAVRQSAPTPARSRPQPWLRRWSTGLAGMAAAAALLIGLIAHNLAPVTQAPMPVVAMAPATRGVVAPPPASPAPTPMTVAARPVPVAPTAPLRVATAPRVAAYASRTMATVPAVTPPAPASRTRTVTLPRPPSVPASPAGPAFEARSPASLALAPPALPFVTAEHPTPETLAPTRVELAPAVTPHAAPAGPARVAMELPKPMPTETIGRPAPAPAARRSRSNWVSRPASTEREIYKSDDTSTRLADARDDLRRDTRDVNHYRSPGLAITH